MKMVKPSRANFKHSLGSYPAAAVLAWAGLVWTIFKVRPGNLLSYFTFFGLLTIAVALTATLPFFFISRRFIKNQDLALRRSRRRAWFLAVGILILGILQLFRLVTLFNAILILAILILIDIYSSP